jgi:hypothetical protein
MILQRPYVFETNDGRIDIQKLGLLLKMMCENSLTILDHSTIGLSHVLRIKSQFVLFII